MGDQVRRAGTGGSSIPVQRGGEPARAKASVYQTAVGTSAISAASPRPSRAAGVVGLQVPAVGGLPGVGRAPGGGQPGRADPIRQVDRQVGQVEQRVVDARLVPIEQADLPGGNPNVGGARIAVDDAYAGLPGRCGAA